MRVARLFLCIAFVAVLPGLSLAQDKGQPAKPRPPLVITTEAGKALPVTMKEPLPVSVSQVAPVSVQSNGYLNGVNLTTNIQSVELYFEGQPTPVQFTPEIRTDTKTPCIAGDWILIQKYGTSVAGQAVEYQDWRPVSQIKKVVVYRYPPSAGKPGLASLTCGQ